MTNSRVGAVFHMGITHERINYPIPSGLVLEVDGAWTNAKDASVGGEMKAKLGVVTHTALGVLFRPRAGNKGNRSIPEIEELVGPSRLVGDQDFFDKPSIPWLVSPRASSSFLSQWTILYRLSRM